MRHPTIDPLLFIHNRKKLCKHLKPNALVVLNANDVMPKNADGMMPFCQNSDLFYLSGIDQAETRLILYPDFKEGQWKEILFLKKTDEKMAVWEAAGYTTSQAKAISGIKTIVWLDAFPSIFQKLMTQAEYVYLNTNEHPRAVVEVQTRDARFVAWCRAQYPLYVYQRLAPIMQQLRIIKSGIEINLIKKACAITAKGFQKILPMVKPGIMEYELEAALISAFICNRASGFAYSPIIASGANTCILHCENNDQMCKSGALVLLDVGAKYAHYHADMTRVLPVNGRFSQRQKAVYKAVLRVMHAAKKLLVPGSSLPEYHQAVGTCMEEELCKLGLLSKTAIQNQTPENLAYKKYFMHGTSHHLGLDVHDVGDIYQKFVPGMVLTVEPGIYIKEEGLGVRLENVVAICENGVEDFMENIPIEPEAIEALMHTG